MDKASCPTSEGRKYGLWKLDMENNRAIRKCKCCGIPFFYPITKNILEQVKKQYDAINLLEAFIKLPFDDVNLMGYLNVIMEDVVGYVEDDETFKPKTILNNHLYELTSSSYISEENKKFIEKFIYAIKIDDNELFWDTMERFKINNIAELAYFNESNLNKTALK